MMTPLTKMIPNLSNRDLSTCILAKRHFSKTWSRWRQREVLSQDARTRQERKGKSCTYQNNEQLGGSVLRELKVGRSPFQL
jgi:hypothetical protein